MQTRPSNADGDSHSLPPANKPAHADSLTESVERLIEEQALVNEALVAKVFAYRRAEEALRATEQKLHDLLARQLANREAERKRMSREIHDSLGQNLLALRMDIAALHRHTAGRHPRLHEWVGAALDNVDFTLHTVKQLLGELRPAGLELGLLATVEMEVARFTRTSRIACRLDADPDIEALPLGEEEMLTVYRVLQECLNNVFRHSLASRVQVQLRAGGGGLELRIADNGIGFDAAAPRKPGSYGLLALQERVAAHGGELRIRSGAGEGAEIILAIPAAPPIG